MNLLLMRINVLAAVYISLMGILFAPPALEAKEISDSTTVIRLGQDWEQEARWSWDQASRHLANQELHAWVEAHPSRFFEANVQNTLSQRPDEYETVGQRHSYYDYMAYYLENLQTATRDVRFFGAATSVTINGELGILDLIDAKSVGDLEKEWPRIAKYFHVSEQSVRTLTAINQRLFKKNMRVIRNLIQTWKAPRDPRAQNPRDAISAFDFDIAMVDFEQSEVQAYIDDNSISDAQVDDITKMLVKASTPLSIVAMMQKWVKKVGYNKFNFGDKGWRIAIGRALVFHFHQKSQEEYLKYMKEHPVPKKTRVGMYDGMQAPRDYSPSTTGYFVVLGSWKTQRGAMRHLAELKSKQPGLQAAVFPPYAPDIYWTVMAASYVAADTASELAYRASKYKLAKNAYKLKRKAVGMDGALQRPAAGSADVYVLSSLVDFTPPPLGNAADELHQQLLSILDTADRDESLQSYTYWRTNFPELQVALYEASGIFHVAIALFTTEVEADLARRAARHAGVALNSITSWRITAGEQLTRIDATGAEYKAVWDHVKKCYKDNITAAALHDCTGMWFTPATLTRCFIQDNCEGLGDDVLKTVEQVHAFYEAQGFDYNTLELKVVESAIPLPKDATAFVNSMINCRNSNGSSTESFMRCAISLLPNASSTEIALKCMQAGMTVQQVMDCANNSGAFPQNVADKLPCFTSDYVDEAAVARCMLGTADQAKVDAVHKCLSSATSEGSALTQCLRTMLSGEDKRKVDCLAKNASDAEGVVSCLLPTEDTKLALGSFRCASKLGATPAEAAQCVASAVGGDAATVATCAASSTTTEEALACMMIKSPEVAAAHQVYICASSGTSAADLISNCTGDALDSRTKALAACVANSTSDDFAGAAATCAASTILPPELANIVGCVSKSTGGIDAALCVAAPQMNAEMRIAMECASTSGGVPMTFAGCTIGRLTAKELELCLSGKIGGDGGCFGSGNTLVMALNTIATDLMHGPGDNNDIVKSVRKLGMFVEQTGQALGNAWDGLFGPDSDFCRGDLTSWMCPGKSSDWCRGDLTSWTC
ncbi:hypothetical protein [Citrobacter freundii]|uniref:hypothetical protein n=1 Tax=Citrobacter freundii TaxID=546 RepID=UPI00255102EB|nr:hypothetical protein [Citrobacter freundii]MDK6379243.1 hypothetical protein [Citrobacter freundii]